jgi:hypothetical protein
LRDSDEAARQKRRRDTRRQLAEAQLWQKKVAELMARNQALESDKDAAADRHVEKCASWQAELAKNEEKMVVSLADRAPIEPAVEARRGELLRLIDTANAELESTLEGIRKAQETLERESHPMHGEANQVQVLENRLASEGWGNPDLLDAQCVEKAKADTANAWIRGVGRDIERQRSLLERAIKDKSQEDIKLIQRRIHRAELEQQAATEMRYAAVTEIERLRQEMINE